MVRVSVGVGGGGEDGVAVCGDDLSDFVSEFVCVGEGGKKVKGESLGLYLNGLWRGLYGTW